MQLLLTVVKLLSKNTTVESSVNVFNNRLGYTQLHISRSAILPATSRSDILAAFLKFSTEAVTSLVIVINCPFTYPVVSTPLQQYSRHWSTNIWTIQQGGNCPSSCHANSVPHQAFFFLQGKASHQQAFPSYKELTLYWPSLFWRACNCYPCQMQP